MSFFDKLQSGLNKLIGPFADRMAKSKYVNAISEGFLHVMPITLGMAVITILINLPFDSWTSLLQAIGIYSIGQDAISLTLSLLGIYVVATISYSLTNSLGEKGSIGSILSTASFLMLMPIQNSTLKSGDSIQSLLLTYMGSDGLFVAILIGLLIPTLYCTLMKKKLKLNLPDSVPPMVSDSLSPTFVAMIVFVIVFVLKYVCSLTSMGNIFSIISTFVAQPVVSLGATPVSMIVIFTFANLLWFFGIHPNSVTQVCMPIFMAVSLGNIQAFQSGQSLPYLSSAIILTMCQIGGTGSTLGVCVSSLFAKSEKYKSMRKLVVPANIFNINEPIIFGFPIMLNPIYFIPMVCGPVLTGGVTYLLIKILPVTFNPTIQMPWVTPGFITAFAQGGFTLLIIWFICLALITLLYLPFFLMDDKKALEQEQKEMRAEAND